MACYPATAYIKEDIIARPVPTPTPAAWVLYHISTLASIQYNGYISWHLPSKMFKHYYVYRMAQLKIEKNGPRLDPWGRRCGSWSPRIHYILCTYNPHLPSTSTIIY